MSFEPQTEQQELVQRVLGVGRRVENMRVKAVTGEKQVMRQQRRGRLSFHWLQTLVSPIAQAQLLAGMILGLKMEEEMR